MSPQRQDGASGQRRGQRAAEARDRRRQAALDAHRRDQDRRAPLAAGLAGAGVVLLVAVAVAAGTLAPPATPEVDGAARPAALTAVPDRAVCAGTPRLPAGAEEATDTQFSPVSTSAASGITSVLLSDLAGRIPGSTLTALPTAPEGAGPDGGEAGGPQRLTEAQPEDVQQGAPATSGEDGVPVRAAAVDQVDAPGGEAGSPTALEVEPLGGQPVPADAVTLYEAADGDLAGTEAGSCAAPAHHHWLAGITTTVGSTAVLVLENPSSSASIVDLSLYGAEGPVQAPGTAGITLAPGQSRLIVLGGLAPDEDHLAVQVTARGGAVGASVQQHRLFGITPGGVEVIQPTAGPAGTAVLPGLVVPTAENASAVTDQDGYGRAGPAVLLAAPTAGATAEVRVIGPEGPVELPGGGVVEVPAGSTARLPLEGLDHDTYTVTVTADAPVVAGARGLSGRAGGPIDFSSVTAVESLGLRQVVARPATARASLVLYADAAGGTVEITPILRDGTLGEALVRELGPETSRTVDFADLGAAGDGGEGAGDEVAGALLETARGTVHAGVDVRGGQGISAYPVQPQPQQVTGVPVRVGY